MNCQHTKFKADVLVIRWPVESDKYKAMFSVKCIECGLPFKFVGFEAVNGVEPFEPRVTLSALDLRVQIEPATQEK